MDNRRFRCCEQVFAISELVIWKWVGQPVRMAPPDRPLCGSSALSTDGLVRPGKRDNWDTLARPRRPACAQQRVGQPAARSDRKAADLRRYLLAGDDLPHLRPLRYAVSRRDAARFRPGAVAFPPGGCRAFPPECRGVSRRGAVAFRGGVPWRFRRTAGSGCRAFPAPVVPAATAPEPAVGLFPGCDPFPGAAVRDGTDPAVRPPAVSR
jgi:hypothetical protein